MASQRKAAAPALALALALGFALAAGPASAGNPTMPPGTEVREQMHGGTYAPGTDVEAAPGGTASPAGGASGAGGSGAGTANAAGSAGSAGSGGGDGQSLGSKATDPTAGLISLNFIEIWTPEYWDADRAGYALRFRPAMPFKAWGIPNILRVSLTFDHGGLPGYGLEDVQIFDLLVFPMLGGRFALGPLVNLASAGSATPSPFAAGPAVGYVRSTDALNLGLFSQNAFGDEYGTSSLQPVLTWHFAKVLDLSPGDLQFTYDWEAVEWVSVPLGAQLGCLAVVAGQPLRLFGAYQFNLRDLPGAPKHAVQAGLVLLVP